MEDALGSVESDTPAAEHPAVSAMLHAVAASPLPVCSQQQGEPDLTEREKVAILRQLYQEKPLVFLERFRTGLREEHLTCFSHLRGDHRADFYCAEVARQGSARPRTLRTRLRNRRYAALRELIQGGEDGARQKQGFGSRLRLQEDRSASPAPPEAGGQVAALRTWDIAGSTHCCWGQASAASLHTG